MYICKHCGGKNIFINRETIPAEDTARCFDCRVEGSFLDMISIVGERQNQFEEQKEGDPEVKMFHYSYCSDCGGSPCGCVTDYKQCLCKTLTAGQAIANLPEIIRVQVIDWMALHGHLDNRPDLDKPLSDNLKTDPKAPNHPNKHTFAPAIKSNPNSLIPSHHLLLGLADLLEQFNMAQHNFESYPIEELKALYDSNDRLNMALMGFTETIESLYFRARREQFKAAGPVDKLTPDPAQMAAEDKIAHFLIGGLGLLPRPIDLPSEGDERHEE